MRAPQVHTLSNASREDREEQKAKLEAELTARPPAAARRCANMI